MIYKYFLFPLLLCTVVSCASRPSAPAVAAFEGTIVYELIARDFSGEMTDDEMRAFVGTEQVYTISGNRYRTELNGSMAMNQIYPGGDTLFTEMRGMPGIFFSPISSNANPVVSSEITRDVLTVAGVRCDLLTMVTENGTTEYYFNTNYAADPADFAKHSYGNWSYAIEKTGSLPLKSISRETGGYYELTAQEIRPGPVADELFVVPELERVYLPE